MKMRSSSSRFPPLDLQLSLQHRTELHSQSPVQILNPQNGIESHPELHVSNPEDYFLLKPERSYLPIHTVQPHEMLANARHTIFDE